MLQGIIDAALVVFIAMNLMFGLAMILKNNSIIDIFWGIGFILITSILAFPFINIIFEKTLIIALVTIWGSRLSIHIYFRNKGKPEDFRYASWRKTWKFFAFRSYFQIFILQGFVMMVIAIPLVAVFNTKFVGNVYSTTVGCLLFIIGFGFEYIADYQMQQFRKLPKNKGHLIKSGLWRLSRHPNYFGEALLWWGLWIISIPGTPWYYSIISPLVITLMLRFVSGVPMLEKKYTHHPEWEDYKNRTPVFIPWLK